MKMRKFECKGCENHCVTTMKTIECSPSFCLYDTIKVNWYEVMDSAENTQTTVDSKQLPKLTVEVFDRPDCPGWAEYAVVNYKGRLSFFSDKPKFEGEDYGCWSCSYAKSKHIDNTNFDASDWQNSLIERPKKQEQLPDWCKVDETYYDYGAQHYFKVTGIDDEKSEVSINWEPNMAAEVISYSIFKEFARPARKRQFNDKEMLDLVGKVLSSTCGEWRSLIIWASGEEVQTYYRSYRAYTLTDDDYTIDGKPCYKLEHLNEKGEWVE